MKNRTVIGIICIAFAFLIFFATIPLMTKNTVQGVSCIRAANRISRGTCITEADIEYYTCRDKQSGSLNDAALIVGKYAVCDIFPGDSFTEAKLSDSSDSAAEALCRLSEGELAVTVPIANLSAGFSAQLENGDIVRVYFQQSDKSVVPKELEFVRVITTVTAEGVSRDGAKAGQQETDSLPATVMLAVNDEQAAILFSHCTDSSLYFAFVCHSDDARAEKYLERQQAFFACNSDVISSTALAFGAIQGE